MARKKANQAELKLYPLSAAARADLLAEFWAIHEPDSYAAMRRLVDKLLDRLTIRELDQLIAESMLDN